MLPPDPLSRRSEDERLALVASVRHRGARLRRRRRVGGGLAAAVLLAAAGVVAVPSVLDRDGVDVQVADERPTPTVVDDTTTSSTIDDLPVKTTTVVTTPETNTPPTTVPSTTTSTVPRRPDRPIAFVRLDFVNGASAYHVHTIKPDGTGDRRVSSTGVRDRRCLSWSADARTIAYCQWTPNDVQLGILDVATGADRIVSVLTTPGEVDTVSLAPDGKRVAFDVQPVGGAPKVVVMHLDGSQRRDVIAGKQPDWSPDGRHLAVAAPTGRDVKVVDVATGAVVVELPNVGDRPRWSSSGTSVVTTRNTELIVTAPLVAGGASAPLPTSRVLFSNSAELGDADWSADEQQVAFTINGKLALVDVTTGVMRRLTSVPQDEQDVSWT